MLFYLKDVVQSIFLKDLPPKLIFNLIFNSINWTFSYTIPMSALLSIIIAVGNLNQRSEIIAARAAGISFFHLIKPYLYLGVLFTVLLYIHQQEIVSYSYSQMQKSIEQIYRHHIIAFIRPGTFTRLDHTNEGYRNLYVGKKIKRDGHSILQNIQIVMVRHTPKGPRVKQFITAKEAEKIMKTSESGRTVPALRLFSGHAIMQDQGKKRTQIINFNNSSFDIHLIPPKKTEEVDKKNVLLAFNNNELIDEYRSLKSTGQPYETYIVYLTEYHKRIALSFSVLFFMLLGFPVSIVNHRTGKGFGLGLSLLFIFIYYALYFSTDTLVLKYHFLAPSIASWFGNILMIFFAIYFFRKRLLILS